MKFRTTLMAEVDVEFVTPDVTKAYFIDGDWGQTFYTYVDLEDMAQSLAYTFERTSDVYIKGKGLAKDIEGYPIFEQDYDNNYYYFKDPECGEVRVWYEMEMDVDGCEEIN